MTNDLKLTEKELNVFKAICQENVEMTYFADVRERLNANGIEMKVPEVRGVVGSLVKKGIVEVFDLESKDFEIDGTSVAYELKRELKF